MLTGGMAGIGPIYDISVVDTAGPSSVSTSHTFTGINFGPDYTNRRILVYIFAQGKQAGAAVTGFIPITSFTVGNYVSPGPLNFWYWTGTTPSTTFSGVQGDGFAPTGTSGTVSFTTGIPVACSIVVFSLTGGNDDGNVSGDGISTNVSPASGTLTFGNDANLIVAVVQNSSATLTFSGSTKIAQFSHVSGYQCAYGLNSHLSAQTNRPISITGAAGPTAVVTDAWLW